MDQTPICDKRGQTAIVLFCMLHVATPHKPRYCTPCNDLCQLCRASDGIIERFGFAHTGVVA